MKDSSRECTFPKCECTPDNDCEGQEYKTAEEMRPERGLAFKFAAWCWGKVMPTEVGEIQGFFQRFLNETTSVSCNPECDSDPDTCFCRAHENPARRQITKTAEEYFQDRYNFLGRAEWEYDQHRFSAWDMIDFADQYVSKKLEQFRSLSLPAVESKSDAIYTLNDMFEFARFSGPDTDDEYFKTYIKERFKKWIATRKPLPPK